MKHANNVEDKLQTSIEESAGRISAYGVQGHEMVEKIKQIDETLEYLKNMAAQYLATINSISSQPPIPPEQPQIFSVATPVHAAMELPPVANTPPTNAARSPFNGEMHSPPG